MTSAEKLPQTDFSGNREVHCYRIGTATWVTQSWSKCKDMTKGSSIGRNKQVCGYTLDISTLQWT